MEPQWMVVAALIRCAFTSTAFPAQNFAAIASLTQPAQKVLLLYSAWLSSRFRLLLCARKPV